MAVVQPTSSQKISEGVKPSAANESGEKRGSPTQESGLQQGSSQEDADVPPPLPTSPPPLEDPLPPGKDTDGLKVPLTTLNDPLSSISSTLYRHAIGFIDIKRIGLTF